MSENYKKLNLDLFKNEDIENIKGSLDTINDVFEDAINMLEGTNDKLEKKALSEKSLSKAFDKQYDDFFNGNITLDDQESVQNVMAVIIANIEMIKREIFSLTEKLIQIKTNIQNIKSLGVPMGMYETKQVAIEKYLIEVTRKREDQFMQMQKIKDILSAYNGK